MPGDRIPNGANGPHRIMGLNLDIISSRSKLHLSLITFLLAVAFAILAMPTVAMAQDGTPGGDPDDAEQITGYVFLGEEVAGPHIVQIQVSPAAPTEGILRFAVRVRELETGEDIDDAIVRIFGTPSEQGEKQYSPALNSPFDPVFYLAQLEFGSAGIWAVDIEVESEFGFGTTVLSLRVNSRTRGAAGSGWGTVLYAISSLAFVSGGLWLWYSSNKARRRQNRQNPRKLRKPRRSQNLE